VDNSNVNKMLLDNSKTNTIKITLDNSNINKVLLDNSKNNRIKIMLDNNNVNRVKAELDNNLNRVKAELDNNNVNRVKLVLDSTKQLNSYSKMTFFHENRQLCVYLIQPFFCILFILISFCIFQ
jgi:hypothetical protein